MAKMDIAIDLGTAYTSIFVSGYGIVLHEPSVIAFFDNGGKRVTRAVGDDAYQMIGKAPDKTKIVYPITDGIIKDSEACSAMLSEFIKRILPESYIVKPKLNAVVGVPTGITVDERKMYEEVLMSAGVDSVSMVNSIMLAAIGAELPVESDYGGFIVSIGAGVTEIGVMSFCGIVNGCSINIGGDMIDRTLVDSIRGLYNMKTDRKTAKKVKEKISSLIRNDRASMNVSGLDAETKNIVTRSVSADALYDAVAVYYYSIVDAIENFINSCSPSVAADIQKNGVTLVGGGANIPGLKELMEDRLELPVKIPQGAHYATITGGGMLLNDPYFLDDILLHS